MRAAAADRRISGIIKREDPYMPDPKSDSPLPASWVPAVLLAWLVPGGGHFLLKRYGRGGILLACITLTFILGLLMRGMLFMPEKTPDFLTTLVYYGGFVADVAGGVLYLVTFALGYNQPDVAGHIHDYGAKFLVAAGLFNILAMVDVYEIATGRKQ
jgi:hypothetical protein